MEDDPLIFLYTGRRAIPVGTFTPEEYLNEQTYAFATEDARTASSRRYRPDIRHRHDVVRRDVCARDLTDAHSARAARSRVASYGGHLRAGAEMTMVGDAAHAPDARR